MTDLVDSLLPVFAERFHLTPSDVYGLTVHQFGVFRDRLEQPAQGMMGGVA